jgi:hypothetical protein
MQLKPFLGTVDALFKQYADNKKLPGVAYGIVYQGQLIHAKGIGFSQIQGNIPAGPQSVFRDPLNVQEFYVYGHFEIKESEANCFWMNLHRNTFPNLRDRN